MCPRYWVIEGKGNQLVWLNLLLGGIVGAIVDSNTGAAASMSPTEFSAELTAARDSCVAECP